MTWSEVLAGPERSFRVVVTREPAMAGAYQAEENWTPPHLRDKVMIDLMFRAIFSQPRTGNEEFWRTMDSIHANFVKYGSLTQGQYNAIRNCYRRASRTA